MAPERSLRLFDERGQYQYQSGPEKLPPLRLADRVPRTRRLSERGGVQAASWDTPAGRELAARFQKAMATYSGTVAQTVGERWRPAALTGPLLGEAARAGGLATLALHRRARADRR